MKSFRELVGEIRTHNEEEALSAKLDALNDMIYPRDGLCQKVWHCNYCYYGNSHFM